MSFTNIMFSTPPALPHPVSACALFLDVDGTLLDIAATPDGVIVPARLPPALSALHAATGGALALVTGRALADIDALFAPLRLPAAGLHGAESRLKPDGAVTRQAMTPDLSRLRAALEALAAKTLGLLLEDKGAAIAVHYRAIPESADDITTRVTALVERHGTGMALQPGKMVLEIRPAGASKGGAVETFLGQKPFAGRFPVMLGDDLTDESAFAAVNAAGGLSIRVGIEERDSAATARLSSPAATRAWLEGLVEG